MQICKSAWVCKLQATMCKWSAGVVRILISHWGRSQRRQHCMTNMFLGRRSWLCGGEIMMAKDIVGTKRFLLFFMLAFTDWSYRLEFWILHIKDAYTKQCNECNVMIRRKVMNQIVEAACMQRTPSWRKPDDPRTRAKYTLKAGQVTFCMRKILIRWLLFLSWKLIESIIPGPYVASPMLTRYQNNEA